MSKILAIWAQNTAIFRKMTIFVPKSVDITEIIVSNIDYDYDKHME
jgi:hypothetical protein